MAGSMKGIVAYRKKQEQDAREKAEIAIKELQLIGKAINFNSVAKQSGVSKSFLYGDEEVKECIEQLREKSVNQEMNRRAKYDKTAKSQAVIIEAKEKRIAKLEEENKKLKIEVEHLRGLLYSINK
jgi:predicted RNase H-like nuclease (RuvC/YqgF family)